MTNRNENFRSELEDLPNELFSKIQSYLTANDFSKAFSKLNVRFDDLVGSMFNPHFEIRSSVADQRLLASTFASRITSISIPADSDAASIATIYSNVRSITFHRSIRFIANTLSTVERIKLDLSLMRLKQAIPLCSAIFSNEFRSLSSFELCHRKSRFVGHWKQLICSIRHQCLTLTEFTFHIHPTIEWKIFEELLKKMPHLQRLIVQKLNTRNQWSLTHLSGILANNLPHLAYVSLRITTLATNKENDVNSQMVHPLLDKSNQK